ncbi:MAG: transcription antiterminator, partial [Tissierellia bacterium]|nr:transcription antiterminator [Tissierellia bacterium]
MFTLTKRQKDIVNYLLKTKKNSTIKEIASVFGVSERTIRYDLDIIESWLDERNIELIRKPGTGISLDVERVNMVDILDELTDLDNIDYSTEERQFYIKLVLFLSTDYITLENISDIVNVSRNTVIQDLDRIEEELKESSFELKRKTYYGIKVIGKESDIRNEILKLIWKGLRDGLLNNKDIKSIFNGINEDHIIGAIKEKEKLLDIAFTEEATKELMLHIGIVTKRVKEGKHIEYLNTLKDDFKKSKYYKTTKASLSIIEENYNIIFNDNEILYVDRIFKGAKTRDSIVFGEECEDVSVIVEETIEDVEKYLGINLKNDIEFINALKTHLQIAFFRLNNNLDIENPLTEQIKYRYPFIFELSRKILDKHKEAFGGKLVDEEIAYMAMHIGAAFERNKSSSFMPNVLLVCGSGLATSNLLKTRLSVMLPELKYIGPIST